MMIRQWHFQDGFSWSLYPAHSVTRVGVAIFFKQLLFLYALSRSCWFISSQAWELTGMALGNLKINARIVGWRHTQQQAATNAPTITFSISSHFYVDLIPATTARKSILRENIWVWNVSRTPSLLLPNPIPPQFAASCVTTAFNLASHFLIWPLTQILDIDLLWTWPPPPDCNWKYSPYSVFWSKDFSAMIFLLWHLGKSPPGMYQILNSWRRSVFIIIRAQKCSMIIIH